MNSSKVFLGILAGLVAGAVLGVLYTQLVGLNTTQKISERDEDFLHE